MVCESSRSYFTKNGYTAAREFGEGFDQGFDGRRRRMTISLPLIGVGVLQAVVYLLFIRSVDLYEREPFRYVIPVFVWGFTVAVFLSLLFNTLFAFTISTVASVEVVDFLTAVVGAPVIEETSKGLALLLTFGVAYAAARRRGAVEFSGVMDGIVYGSAVGFGFAIAEDILYYAQFGPETFVIRRVFGGFAHAAFTSLIGVGIGLIPWVRSRSLKVALPLLGLLGAILLHAAFNFTAFVLGPLAYVVMFFVILAYVVLIVVWLAVERRTIRRELKEEVDRGLITADEYAIIPTYFRRTGYYLELIFSGRLRTWWRASKVHSKAVDLAMTKNIARRPFGDYGEENVEHLRRRVRQLKGLAAQEPGA
jgi:protease PrsW